MHKTKINPILEIGKLKRVSEILKAIAHPTRLNVLEALEVHKRLSVNELMTITDTTQSLLSNHLIKMKDKGVLKSERDGKNIYYQLVDEHLLNIFACMEECSLIS
jgi:ArsR family transcriptional regulator